MAVNPDDFGFVYSPDNVPGRRRAAGYMDSKDYFLCSYHSSGDSKPSAIYISLNPQTAELAKIAAGGDMVGVRINSKGDVLLGDFEPRRKLSNANNGYRFQLSIAKSTDFIIKAVGRRFRRAYLDAKPYASGEAVLLHLNGDFDEERGA